MSAKTNPFWARMACRTKTSRVLVLLLATSGVGGCTNALQNFDALATARTPATLASAAPSAVAGETRQLAEGRRLFRAQDFAGARNAYQAAVQADPSGVQGWIGLAAAENQMGRFDLSDRAYSQAERLGGRTKVLLNNRGYSLYLRGEIARAEADFAAARLLAPEDPVVRANESLVAAQVGGTRAD